VNQLVGGHADLGQAMSLQFTDSASQCNHQRHLKLYWFFHPCPVVLREVVDEGKKDGLMIFSVKPLLMPSLEGRFQREVKEVAMWVGLNTDTAFDLSFSSTRLVF
jgi:hypothetical protein